MRKTKWLRLREKVKASEGGKSNG
jgi:hypothetical protein